MVVEESDIPPGKVETELKKLGWKNRHDLNNLWKAMKKWVQEKGHEKRKYLSQSNIRDELVVFFNDIYAPKFLTETRLKKNPKINLIKPSGPNSAQEILREYQSLKSAFLRFADYFKGRADAKAEMERLCLTKANNKAASLTGLSKNPEKQHYVQPTVQDVDGDSDSDVPLMNGKRARDPTRGSPSKRSRTSSSSHDPAWEMSYTPGGTPALSDYCGREYTLRRDSSTRERISRSMTYMDHVGITENPLDADKVSYTLPVRTRQSLNAVDAAQFRDPFTGNMPTDFGSRSMSLPSAAVLPDARPRTASSSQPSLPCGNSMPDQPSTPPALAKLKTPPAPDLMTVEQFKSRANQSVMEPQGYASPTTQRLEQKKEPIPTTKQPEWRIQCIIKGQSDLLNSGLMDAPRCDLPYNNSMDDTLFDAVASHLNFDSEDVSRIRISLQDPPLTLAQEFRVVEIARNDAAGLGKTVRQMADRAVRKMLLLSIKRETGAVLTFVIEDVPPVITGA